MLKQTRAMLCRVGRFAVVAACLALPAHGAQAEVAGLFHYSIEDVVVNPISAETWTVNVVLAVTNTVTGERCDIRFARPFQVRGADFSPALGPALITEAGGAGSDNVLLALVSSTALGGGAEIGAPMRNPQAMHASIPRYGEGSSCRGGHADD